MGLQQIEIPVRGMDCAGCCSSVQKALVALPGVQQADVLLAAEKAVVQDTAQVDVPALHRAVEGAGYTVPIIDAVAAPQTDAAAQLAETGNAFTRSVLLFNSSCYLGIGRREMLRARTKRTSLSSKP